MKCLQLRTRQEGQWEAVRKLGSPHVGQGKVKGFEVSQMVESMQLGRFDGSLRVSDLKLLLKLWGVSRYGLLRLLGVGCETLAVGYT
jgi:hypothetical protein